jgi:hypothetical protein
MRARPGARRATGEHACARLCFGGSPEDADQEIGVPRGALPIPRLEMRSSPSAEPTGRRGTVPIASLRATGPKMRAGTPALPGGGLANPTVGDALVPERGARRATGNRAYRQPARDGSQDAGEDARAPRGGPCQSHGWRCARPRAQSPPGDGRPCLSPACARRVPRCGRGRPRSQGEPCQSHGWRCARPRARSPQGDGQPCLSPACARRVPRCGRGRPRSQGGALPIPRLEMRSSSSAEPAGRRGTMHIPAMDRRVPRCGRGRPRSQGGNRR